ncbi:alcohol dehydrogenase, propanol-preferring [Zhouia amylolytica]|uniref:alcohol dehydrogenase n=1 Tax=Zhouia amylolytica TaxID=376730 RepID=A0A1I6S4K1_9FLAO|nr:NAD(P)-dependent alcohol dehydrogenase [Zhouia amylolytica]SFS71871.1 alcohol dehydrogenase, propanol-preferring [Zhouia amylolytica]
MKAVRFYGTNDVRIETMDKPTPQGDEVLIKIGGAGVCHSDLHVIHDGIMGEDPQPFTLGHENAGWVEATGNGVKGFKKGDAVLVYGPWGCGHCKPCQQSAENYCDHQSENPYGGGLGLNGGMADFMLVPSSRLLVHIKDLDPIVAAPLTDAALTPYAAIRRSKDKLTSDAFVVVLGIGGLGHVALQILKATSAATIIAGDVTADKLQLAKDHGVDFVINTTDDDVVSQIQKITGIKKAAVVLDFVGIQPTINIGQQVVGLNGDLTIVGLGGGHLDFHAMAVPLGTRISTPYWGTRVELMEVIELARHGKIKIDIEKYKLDQAHEVYDKLLNGKIKGRAVLTP